MKLLNIELKLYTDAIQMTGPVYRIIGYHYTDGRAHGHMAAY